MMTPAEHTPRTVHRIAFARRGSLPPRMAAQSCGKPTRLLASAAALRLVRSAKEVRDTGAQGGDERKGGGAGEDKAAREAEAHALAARYRSLLQHQGRMRSAARLLEETEQGAIALKEAIAQRKRGQGFEEALKVRTTTTSRVEACARRR